MWRLQIFMTKSGKCSFDKIYKLRLIDIIGLQGMRLTTRYEFDSGTSAILTRIKEN